MGLNYDRLRDAKAKNPNEQNFVFSKDFPECKGMFPDCPAEPSLMASMCRTCPKTDGLKKPKLED